MERNMRHEEHDSVKVNAFQRKRGGLLQTVHVDLLLRRDFVRLHLKHSAKQTGGM